MALPDRIYRSTLARVVAVIIAVILVVTALSYLVGSSTVARYAANRANKRLSGYTLHIRRVYFHPFTFAVDATGVSLSQNANPKPPLVVIGKLHASLQWRALVRLAVVGDIFIDHPKAYINLKQIEAEEKSKTPLSKKGWQQAIEAVYPLKINVLRIDEGDLTFVPQSPYEPLHMTHLYVWAEDIRNVVSPKGAYPSPVHFEGVLFGKGKIIVDGHANFLLQPTPGAKGNISLSDLDLGYLRPITNLRNIDLRKGTMSAKGDFEYAPAMMVAHLAQVEIKGLDADYVHLAATAEREKQTAEKAKETAKEAQNKPGMKLRIDLLTIADSVLGFVNKATKPNYRIFTSKISATVKNFSNKFAEGPASVDIHGLFMGSGETKATGAFRSETKGADFTINLSIVNTQLPSMNDLFRAYGKFDIQKGLFSLYAQIAVHNDAMNGYIKPLFADVLVVDMRTRQEKGVFHKLYVGVVKGLSKLLKNPSTKQVATVTRLHGPLPGRAGVNTGQAIVNLVQNAFLHAILPGFERQATAGNGQSK